MHSSRFGDLVLALAFVALTAMVGLRTAYLLDERRATVARAEAGLRDLSRVLEQYVTRIFETSELVTEGIAGRTAELGGADRLRGDIAVHHWLLGLQRRMAGDHLLVVNAAGRPVAVTSQHPAPEVDLSDRRWFRAHMNGAERHIGEALYSRITDDILFTYSRPLRRADGGFDGAVQVAVRPAFFQQASLMSEFGGATVLGLFDEDGRVLARTGLRPDQVTARMPAELLRPVGGRAVSMVRYRAPFDRQDRLVAVRQVADWPVVVTASVPAAQVLAGWWRSVWWSAAVLGAVALGVLAVAWQARRMLRREAATRAALDHANAALRDAASGLEARVAERTRALAQARDALAERETRFRAIFDSTFQFIGLLSPDGTLLEVNGAALAFTGRRREELVGRPFADQPWWIDDAARDRVRAAIAAAAAGTPQRYETTATGADGVVAAVDFSLKPIRDAEGRVVLLVPEGHDITDLKAAEVRLREAQKTEMLGQLTGGVAHDFNNLLMAVMGNLALLRKRLPDEPRLIRLVDGAQQGAERGAALTQRLLAFARRQELRPEPVDVPCLLRGVAPLLERSAGPAIRLRLDTAEGLPPALADANQLELALLNLVVNARDAMTEGGEIAVRVAEAVVPSPTAPAGLVPGRYLVVTVQDGGIGMDGATLARATEPFFTTKGPGRGSGLGLSMVQGLAEQSGGGLVLRSTPGRGTAAAIWLPRATARPAVTPVPPQAEPAQAPPRRVLVVDDDPLVAAGTAMMLEDLGHRAVVVGSGGEALATLAGDPAFDLVLTDGAMPGMSGLELAERLGASHPGLPVALATGYADLGGGTAGWLPRLGKPYRQEELAALVGRLTAALPVP